MGELLRKVWKGIFKFSWLCENKQLISDAPNSTGGTKSEMHHDSLRIIVKSPKQRDVKEEDELRWKLVCQLLCFD